MESGRYQPAITDSQDWEWRNHPGGIGFKGRTWNEWHEGVMESILGLTLRRTRRCFDESAVSVAIEGPGWKGSWRDPVASWRETRRSYWWKHRLIAGKVPEIFGDASTMGHLTRTTAASDCSWCEPRKQAVCAAEDEVREVMQTIWGIQTIMDESEILDIEWFTLLEFCFCFDLIMIMPWFFPLEMRTYLTYFLFYSSPWLRNFWF